MKKMLKSVLKNLVPFDVFLRDNMNMCECFFTRVYVKCKKGCLNDNVNIVLSD